MLQRYVALIALFSVSIATLSAMPIPREMKDTVAFLFTDTSPSNYIPLGTCFFVGAPHPINDKMAFAYLVTARHVLQTPDQKSWLKFCYVRLNTTGGGSEYHLLSIVPEGPKRNVFVHPDPTVDLAVMPLTFPLSVYDQKFIPLEMLTKKEEIASLEIAEGTDLLFVGMFVPHLGQVRNQPIVRFGKLAMLTTDKVITPLGNAEVFLAEASAYGGNSGSPAFFWLGADRKPGQLSLGGPAIKVAGVVQFHFNDLLPINFVAQGTTPIVSPNNGICGIVPSYLIKDIIDGPDLYGKRLNAVAAEPQTRKK